jgi:hypothetical protein
VCGITSASRRTVAHLSPVRPWEIAPAADSGVDTVLERPSIGALFKVIPRAPIEGIIINDQLSYSTYSTQIMSLSEEFHPLEATTCENPPSTPNSQVRSAHRRRTLFYLTMQVISLNDQSLSPNQPLRQLEEKLRRAHSERDALQFQLWHSRICYEAESQSSQAFKHGLENLQRELTQLGATYTSRYEECDREKDILQARCWELDSDNEQLREHLRVADELIACYKRLVDMSEEAHQKPVGSVYQGWSVLPQDNGSDYCHPITLPPISLPPSTLPPSLPSLSLNHEFAIDSANLRPIGELDYGIGPAVDTCFGTDLLAPPYVSSFDDLTEKQTAQHPPSNQHSTAISATIGDEKGSGGKEHKSSKKRKSKCLSG